MVAVTGATGSSSAYTLGGMSGMRSTADCVAPNTRPMMSSNISLLLEEVQSLLENPRDD